MAHFEIEAAFIGEQNAEARAELLEDHDYLGNKLHRKNIDIENLVTKAEAFRVAVPSWGVGTGGTRFARFPMPGEHRDI
jgi:L-rhamnose isomerase / sugar isomerase